VSGDYLIAREGTPGAAEPARTVIRRLSDGAVKDAVSVVPVAPVQALGGDALFATLEGSATGGVLAIRDGAVAWRVPFELLAQRAPTPLSDGGAAVQLADPMCGHALDAAKRG